MTVDVLVFEMTEHPPVSHKAVRRAWRCCAALQARSSSSTDTAELDRRLKGKTWRGELGKE